MKTAVVTLLIVLSLGANAVLAWKLRPSSTSSAGETSARSASASDSSSRARNANAPARADGKVPGGNWQTLEGGGDLPGLVVRLRAAGYPASVVRAIVAGAVQEQFAPRLKALTPKPEENGFWVGRSPLSALSNPATMAARREIYREQTQLLKQLLGSDADMNANYQIEMSASMRRQYGDLPREKIDLIQQIAQDYGEMTSQIRAESQGITLREDREKLAFLETERRKDLAKVLTPAEMEEYLLRTSSSASQLRFQLTAFEPNEQEFRSLYKLQERYDEQFGQYGSVQRDNPEYSRLRQAAEQKMIADAKALLGPERGAEFERSRDYNFTNVANIAKRLDLPKEAAVTVWELQKDFQQRTAELQRDRNLTPEARTERVTALQAEANAKVLAALGPRGHAAYQENAGTWLRSNNAFMFAGAPAPGATAVRQGTGDIIMIRPAPAPSAPAPTPAR